MCPKGGPLARARGAWNGSPTASRVVWVGLCSLLLAACSFPGSVKPTVKLGLSAPFEGLDRNLGYEVLHAMQLAVRERNAEGGVGQFYLVELVALNDYNEADRAEEQARKMAVDPRILGVLGGWSQETQGVAQTYDILRLAFLAPEIDISALGDSMSVDSGFAARYAELSGGVAPTSAAVWAYGAANRLMDAIEDSTLSDGHPSRCGVREALQMLGW